MATMKELAERRATALETEIVRACDGASVSLFANAFDKDGSVEGLADVLLAIARCDLAEDIRKLRARLANGERKAYDSAKRGLPAVAVSAVLAGRDAAVPVGDRVVVHTGLLQADFDGKGNTHLTVAQMVEALRGDPHVMACFVSPSGQGVKALVRIPADAARHGEAFDAAARYFAEKYTLTMDPAARDVGRLCFLSSDPGIWVNPEAVEIVPVAGEKPALKTGTQDSRTGSLGFPDTTAADIREMLSFIPPMHGQYEDWLKVTSAVFSALPLEAALPLLEAWTPPKHAGDYERKWKHRLQRVGVGTLAWYAERHGFDARAAARRKRWCGRIKFAHGSRSKARPEPAGTVAEEPEDGEDALEKEFVAECLRQGQRGDAELWSRIARGTHCWDCLAMVWRRYEDGLWVADEAAKTRVEAIDALAGIYEELAAGLRGEIKAEPVEDGAKDHRKGAVENIGRRVGRLRSTGYSTAMLELAKPLLAARATDFDRSPHLLAAMNVVVDFEAGQTREFRPEDRLTRRVPVRFDPEAECPRWEAFLDRCLGGDAALIAYIRRAVGYSLTGYVDADCLFFHYGKGANGKSTFLAALKMLCAELMVTIDIESLLARRSDNNFDYKKAMLEGCRLAVTDEIPENRRLNEAAIKALVGGDQIVARRPYERPYNFIPTHKLWMAGNHKPAITGSDLGIWRRIHLVPWTVTIPEEDRRPRHELLAGFRAELPGILAWALAGYQDLLDQGGLCPPPAVVEAVREYRSESDQFSLFVGDRIERVLGERVALGDVLKAYLAWCQDEGEEPVARSGRQMAKRLKETGFKIEEGHARMRLVCDVMLVSTGEEGEKKKRWWGGD